MANLPSDIQQEIEAKAKQYAQVHCGDPATNRAQKLVDALEEWQKLDFRIHTSVDAAMCHLKAKAALQEWEKGEGV